MAQLIELNDKQRQIATMVQFLDAPTTPYTSQLSVKSELVDVKWEQPVEKYRRLGTKGKMDGKDVTQFNSQTPDTIACHAQKFEEGVAVSDFTQETKSATVAKRAHLKDQVNKGLIVLKHAQEGAFCSRNDSSADDQNQTPHQTRGIFKWPEAGPSSYEPVPAKYTTPAAQVYSGTLANVNDDVLKAMGAALFKSRRGGQSALKMFAGIEFKAKLVDLLVYQKTAPSGYVNSVQVDFDGQKKEVCKIVDFIQVDGVTIEVHPTAFNLVNPDDGEDTDYTHKSAFAVDMAMVGIAYQRLPAAKPLEDKGGGPRAIPNMISMHVVKNPQAILTFNISAAA